MLINFLRRICPRSIKSIRHERTLKKHIEIYRKNIQRLNRDLKKDSTIKVVFILQYPETWNSMRTVYENAVKKGMHAKILCVPKPKNISDPNYNMSSINEAYEFLKNDSNAINAYLGDSKWFDLKEFCPDYVFYTRPYNSHYPNVYKSETVCQYTKICYIPYGFILNDGMIFNSVFHMNFILQTYLIFAPSKNILKKLKKFYMCQYLLKYNKFKYLGFPRFDLLLDDNFNKKTKSDNPTITWMPRWEFDTSSEGQKLSHFLEYYDEFIAFVKTHQELNFIFRPHPLMWETLINEELKTEEEIEEIKKELASINNLSIDNEKDYLPTLKNTDILIADTTSLLIEFFVTGKPIILCDNGQGYLKDGKIMVSSLYQVNTWKDVEVTLKQLINGDDKLYSKRQKAINKIIPRKSIAGETIINYIIDDYKNRGRDGK